MGRASRILEKNQNVGCVTLRFFMRINHEAQEIYEKKYSETCSAKDKSRMLFL
jgi:hypothetical protein